MNLRDHDRACEHGSRREHWVDKEPSRTDRRNYISEGFRCPGGAPIVAILASSTEDEWALRHDGPVLLVKDGIRLERQT